jgi:hypothetical protein
MKWGSLSLVFGAVLWMGCSNSDTSGTCSSSVTEYCKVPDDFASCRPDGGWTADAACPSVQELNDNPCVSGATTQGGPRSTNGKCCYDVKFLCD